MTMTMTMVGELCKMSGTNMKLDDGDIEFLNQCEVNLKLYKVIDLQVKMTRCTMR